jgi:hypothetical protein
VAPYFFFFFFAAFFFAMMSPPSRSPRVTRSIIDRTIGEGKKRVKRKIPDRGSVTRCSPHILGAGTHAFSWADDGLRCSRRFTYSWLSGTPFLQSGQVSGG